MSILSITTKRRKPCLAVYLVIRPTLTHLPSSLTRKGITLIIPTSNSNVTEEFGPFTPLVGRVTASVPFSKLPPAVLAYAAAFNYVQCIPVPFSYSFSSSPTDCVVAEKLASLPINRVCNVSSLSPTPGTRPSI